jgi:polysaccharide biosynthesis transport protein
LTILPALKAAAVTSAHGKSASRKAEIADVHFGQRQNSAVVDIQQKFLRYVVNEPLTGFAEAIRMVKVSADIQQAIKVNKVVGVTSTVQGEGKSTLCCNLAELMAHAGKRVILIDGDLHNPSVSRSLAPGAKVGLLEVFSGKIELQDAIMTDEETKLAFLPAVRQTRLAHSSEVLASEVFKRLVDNLRATYDYVLIDLPPLAPVVDVRATTNVIDSYVYVIEWGRTRKSIVQDQLSSAPEVYDRLLGVVLNKANVGVLARYDYYYGRNYHRRYYGQYGYGYGR